MPKAYNGRRLDFIFASIEEREQFHKEAEALGCSTDCKYLRYIYDYYKNRDLPKPSANDDIQKLKDDLAKISRELREANRLISVQDDLIGSLKNRDLEVIPLNQELISLLQESPIHDIRIIDRLGANGKPGEIAAIQQQLTILETTGRARKTAKGWIWNR